MMTIVTHVRLKDGLGVTGTPPCARVCRPRENAELDLL
jgi:hypothetical protein